MKTKALFVSLIACLSCMATNVDADTVQQFGKGVGSTCGTWTAERRTPSEWTNAGNWVLGFVSGSASATDRDFLDGLDANAVLAWMDNYCRIHPLDKIAVGATRFVELRANGH